MNKREYFQELDTEHSVRMGMVRKDFLEVVAELGALKYKMGVFLISVKVRDCELYYFSVISYFVEDIEQKDLQRIQKHNYKLGCD